MFVLTVTLDRKEEEEIKWGERLFFLMILLLLLLGIPIQYIKLYLMILKINVCYHCFQ